MDRVVDLYREGILDPGKQPAFLLLLGLVLGFAAIRSSTRLIKAQVRWWPGNVHVGGVHLHHELFGVVAVIATGSASFVVSTGSDWHDVLALGFGAGCGIVLDEFALLLHLRDVYWLQEGRASVDAVVVAAALSAMLVLGAAPFSLTGATASGASSATRWYAAGLVAINLGLTLVTLAKGKFWLALLSVPLWGVGLVSAFRLGRPASPWGRRCYRPGTRKLRRAQARDRRWERRRTAFTTAIGGHSDPPTDVNRGRPAAPGRPPR